MKNAALYEASKAVLALFYGGKLENAGFEGGQLRLEFKSEINDQDQSMKGLEGLSFEKKNLEELIKIKMAGRVYRETFGKDNDTRSIADWAKVSRVSLAYSRSLAMNGGGEGYILDQQGTPISTKAGKHDPALESHGNLISVQSKDKISEQMSSRIDQEAVDLIAKSYRDVEKVLKLGLRKEVELLASHLQKKEKLTVEEVKKIVGFKDKDWKADIKKLI